MRYTLNPEPLNLEPLMLSGEIIPIQASIDHWKRAYIGRGKAKDILKKNRGDPIGNAPQQFGFVLVCKSEPGKTVYAGSLSGIGRPAHL